MIIQRLRGGLGNQLFQYFAVKNLGRIFETQVKFDLGQYKRDPRRKSELHKLSLEAEEASEDDIAPFLGKSSARKYLDRRTFYFFNRHVFAQPYFHFVGRFFKLKPPVYLSGYWQDEHYFRDIRTQILESVEPAQPLSDQNKNWIEKMSGASVSVHIRRGDYLSKDYSGHYKLVGKSYYDQAFEEINLRVGDVNFFFFSDDIEWCRKTFAHMPNSYFVSNNTGEQSFLDLYLMSKCAHNIIANSTFSWWGAWLNANTDKVVIAPERRFRRKIQRGLLAVYPSRLYLEKSYIPQDWITLSH